MLDTMKPSVHEQAEGESMRPSRHFMRALVAAVTLLFATLLTVECASAQVAPERSRVATSAEPQPPSVSQPSGAGEDACRLRHTARQTVNLPASPVPPGHVCGCDFRTAPPHRATGSVTMREAAQAARPVGLPLLHQTLRC